MILDTDLYYSVKNYLDEVSAEYPHPDTTILDDLATRYFGTTNELHNLYLKKTLIAAIARNDRPACHHPSITILTGAEGVGKSRFWRTLFGNEYVAEIAAYITRDEVTKLHRCWCAEWEGVKNLNKESDVESLKCFLSSRVDSFRTAGYLRWSIIVETTQQENLQSLPIARSRNFWIIPVNQNVPLEKLEEERDRIWSAAYALYQSGEKWWLSPKEALAQP